jgi:nicotinate phosphoribosyltransferase
MHERGQALMVDLYQLTMAAGYFRHALHDKRVSFELFFRRLPPSRRYVVAAGLESCLTYLRSLKFTESQIAYLRDVPALRSAMSFEFVEFLRDFRFRGDVDAMSEGTVCFANEPLVRVTGTLLEAQLVETFLLSAINTESVVASKASRIVRAAGSSQCLEFGSRRTSPEEAVASARAAYLAGFSATSNVEAGYRYDIPVSGTAAHSWTMSHRSEQEAFAHYLEAFPNHSIMLVDTYDTIEGTKRAIAVAKDRLKGVRLDSGDLLQLSKDVRKLLDAAGLQDTIIVASGDLNEYKIHELRQQGAPIDVWGVGTELVRSIDHPTLGAVYKIVYDHSADRPVSKLSQSKASLPGLHQVYRKRKGNKAASDVIGTLQEFHVESEPLLVEWMKGGELVRELPSLSAIRSHCREQIAALPEDCLRFDPGAPQYEVVLSDGLQQLIDEVSARERAENV